MDLLSEAILSLFVSLLVANFQPSSIMANVATNPVIIQTIFSIISMIDIASFLHKYS